MQDLLCFAIQLAANQIYSILPVLYILHLHNKLHPTRSMANTNDSMEQDHRKPQVSLGCRSQAIHHYYTFQLNDQRSQCLSRNFHSSGPLFSTSSSASLCSLKPPLPAR